MVPKPPRRRGGADDESGMLNSDRLQQAESQAELHVVGAVRETEFLGDALLVGLDRLRADEQSLADLGRRVAARHVHQHVALALGERLVLRTLVGMLTALR